MKQVLINKKLVDLKILLLKLFLMENDWQNWQDIYELFKGCFMIWKVTATYHFSEVIYPSIGQYACFFEEYLLSHGLLSKYPWGF